MTAIAPRRCCAGDCSSATRSVKCPLTGAVRRGDYRIAQIRDAQTDAPHDQGLLRVARYVRAAQRRVRIRRTSGVSEPAVELCVIARLDAHLRAADESRR